MRARVRLIVALVVLIAVGVLIGSAVSQWGWLGEGVVPGAKGEPPTRIRVEVLNGGGTAGAARDATDALRDRGFDVVYFGNARSFDRDSSEVLDRVGNLENARAVADALRIRIVRSEPDENLYLDVTVVLGKDWTPEAARDRSAERPVRAWWDPRGWLRR